jgi:hypothetical protein
MHTVQSRVVPVGLPFGSKGSDDLMQINQEAIKQKTPAPLCAALRVNTHPRSMKR